MSGDANRPWSESTSDAFGQRAMNSTFYEVEETRIRFWGACPACSHDFVYFWPLEVIRLEYVEEPVVMCRCAADTHAGRPQGAEPGCGAYWISGVRG